VGLSPQQSPLYEFFGVGVDVDRAPLALQKLDTLEQVRHVVDVPVTQLSEQLIALRVELLGKKQPQCRSIAILSVNAPQCRARTKCASTAVATFMPGNSNRTAAACMNPR
jgi:hypothetical protein